MVLGRALQSGYALFLLNNRNGTADVSCDVACMKEVGVAAGIYTVTDVWTGQPLVGSPALSCESTKCELTVSVPGLGASVYVRLDPKKELGVSDYW